MSLKRRNVLKTLAVCSSGRILFGASDFWNKKQAADWSPQEIAQLMSASPWARQVNADFISDPAVPTPTIGRGGGVEAPATPQFEVGGQPRSISAGAKRREPVTVRWESARPIREAGGIALAAAFKDRYVVSVSGLPMGVMDRRRGESGDLQRMIEQLRASATLEAKGQEPEQPGVVEAAPRAPNTYLFGFSKDLLPLDAGAREILFTLQTGMLAVKAKFDAKTMLYRGALAL